MKDFYWFCQAGKSMLSWSSLTIAKLRGDHRILLWVWDCVGIGGLLYFHLWVVFTDQQIIHGVSEQKNTLKKELRKWKKVTLRGPETSSVYRVQQAHTFVHRCGSTNSPAGCHGDKVPQRHAQYAGLFVCCSAPRPCRRAEISDPLLRDADLDTRSSSAQNTHISDFFFQGKMADVQWKKKSPSNSKNTMQPYADNVADFCAYSPVCVVDHHV